MVMSNRSFKPFIRCIRIATVSLLAIILCCNLLVFAVGAHRASSVTASSPVADAIIVFGASVRSTGPSPMLQDRLDTALEQYRLGRADRILVSGDHGTPEYNEVQAMKDYLVERGVPAGAVFMDHAGFDTYSTLYRARDVFGIERAVLCTQSYHLYRACYIGRRLGLDVTGAPGARRRYPSMVKQHIREAGARVKAVLQVELLRSEPRYLGDPIDIRGDGSQTDDSAGAGARDRCAKGRDFTA